MQKYLVHCPHYLYPQGHEHKSKHEGMSVSARAHAQMQGLVPKVLHPCHPRLHKFYFFKQQLMFECPHHSSCIHFQANVSSIGPCHLPNFWIKKPKATTKAALTSHQLGKYAIHEISCSL